MPWHSFITRKLHLRIWFTVVGSVILPMLIVIAAWHIEDQARLLKPSMHKVEVTDAQGRVVFSSVEPARRFPSGDGLQFNIQVDEDGDGKHVPLVVQMKPRPNQRYWENWLSPPYDFWFVLLLTGTCAMAIMFPFAQRLTRRLENLQNVIQRWERGDLSVRSPRSGDDEITDLARHFNATADRMAALVEAQKALLAYASHELRSPLARMRMAIELVAPPSDPASQESRAEILRDFNELDEIIGKILLVNHMEIKAVLNDTEPVDLVGLLAEECARTGAALNVAPSVIADPSCCVIDGSLLLLRHAVRNLLENAAKHGKRPEGTSETSVLLEREDAPDHAILIHVDDCGPGIPMALRESIFEPFYRLHTPGQSGFGLGLALVRMVADRHGGSVTCDDREGGGARFTLHLPYQAQAAPQQLSRQQA